MLVLRKKAVEVAGQKWMLFVLMKEMVRFVLFPVRHYLIVVLQMMAVLQEAPQRVLVVLIQAILIQLMRGMAARTNYYLLPQNELIQPPQQRRALQAVEGQRGGGAGAAGHGHHHQHPMTVIQQMNCAAVAAALKMRRAKGG